VPIARWKDGKRNLLFVGRHEPRKGLLELLKAYRILRKTGCDCRLLVVGQGPLSREARRYVATRRLGGVEFLGRVSEDEKAQLFRTADVYVSPATGGESFGIVLLEAMAAGTPIVASDIHGYKGVVRRDREALLVEPRQPKQIAAAVARILRDDELRAEMSRAELARAQEFSWERVTAKVDEFYGVVIRRLAARDALPPSFHASIPPSPRAAPASPDRNASVSEAATTPDGLPEPELPEPTPAARG
jgi:phosphatidylinositol alpha-mannosyltransferase